MYSREEGGRCTPGGGRRRVVPYIPLTRVKESIPSLVHPPPPTLRVHPAAHHRFPRTWMLPELRHVPE